MATINVELLTTDQAAEALGITRSLVLRYIRGGRILARRVGYQWLIDRRDLDEFAKQPRNPGPKPRA